MMEIVSTKTKILSFEDRQRLYQILIYAYAETEKEIWGENYPRISFNDFNGLVDKGEILVAYHEGLVVGGIRYYKLTPDVFGFGLLCADLDKSGLGIGRALINAVEEITTTNGIKTIRIEILRPKDSEVEFKTRISKWYQGMGYAYTYSKDFVEVDPDKAPDLITPSCFDFYEKLMH
ncbi:GNAT family N-acetyltransferase [Flagellimonas sp. 2504JD1-5]